MTHYLHPIGLWKKSSSTNSLAIPELIAPRRSLHGNVDNDNNNNNDNNDTDDDNDDNDETDSDSDVWISGPLMTKLGYITGKFSQPLIKLLPESQF